MNSEFWNKMAEGMTEHFEKCFKERLLEILPPVANERNVGRISEDWSLDTVGEVEGWNACLSEIKRRADIER